MAATAGQRGISLRRQNKPAAAKGSIRPFQPQDEAAVVKVWHRAGLLAYPYLPTWQTFSLEQAQRVFGEHILGRCQIWVATVDETIAAYLALDGSYIDRLYVDPAWQRNGLGVLLLEKAQELHPSGLTLHTHVQNKPARAFYEKHGFEVVKFGISPPPESAPDVEYRWPAQS